VERNLAITKSLATIQVSAGCGVRTRACSYSGK